MFEDLLHLLGEPAHRALAWAQQQLDRRGGQVVIVARYIPGGRTAATFTAGATLAVEVGRRYRLRR